jgi:sulfoxide reductase heme-binding subunit YedZ
MSAVLTSALWYLGRGTGAVMLTLFTLVLVLGIVTRSGRALPGLPRLAVASVHRSASLLGVGLLVVHVGSLLFDPYAQLSLLDVVVPFGGTYRPLWLAGGTLALDLMLALVVTSLLRERIGPAMWRAIHWAAYAAWPLAWVHGLGIGTDNGTLWYQLIAWGSLVAVAVAVIWRMVPGFQQRRGLPRVSPSAAGYASGSGYGPVPGLGYPTDSGSGRAAVPRQPGKSGSIGRAVVR